MVTCLDLFGEKPEALSPEVVVSAGVSRQGSAQCRNLGPATGQAGCFSLSFPEAPMALCGICRSGISELRIRGIHVCLRERQVLTRPGGFCVLRASLIGLEETLILHSSKAEERGQRHSPVPLSSSLNFKPCLSCLQTRSKEKPQDALKGHASIE